MRCAAVYSLGHDTHDAARCAWQEQAGMAPANVCCLGAFELRSCSLTQSARSGCSPLFFGIAAGCQRPLLRLVSMSQVQVLGSQLAGRLRGGGGGGATCSGGTSSRNSQPDVCAMVCCAVKGSCLCFPEDHQGPRWSSGTLCFARHAFPDNSWRCRRF